MSFPPHGFDATPRRQHHTDSTLDSRLSGLGSQLSTLSSRLLDSSTPQLLNASSLLSRLMMTKKQNITFLLVFLLSIYPEKPPPVPRPCPALIVHSLIQSLHSFHSSSCARLDVALVVAGGAAAVLVVGRRLELLRVHRVAQDATNATEAAHKLRALLGAVRDELELAPELLVVVGQPLQHGALLQALQLHARLLVVKQLLVLLLLRREVQNGLDLRLVVDKHVPVNL
mmetsp:Transcript_9139/g.22863  ORF Transcript_9139/g.22863 Transcript_9139/m.22863 type:complete len:228 (-) Transcript_9139:1082-1765(-)